MERVSTNGKTTLYQRVVDVTQDYFGPTADRFITRQIRNHLNKEPEQLEKKDLKGLINWISLAMSLLVDDEKLIKQFVGELKSLTNGNLPADY